MFAKFFQFKKNLFLAILLLVIFVLPTEALAQDLLTVGSASSVLSGTESAIFANISNSSPTSTFLLMLKSGSVGKFSVDKDGNTNAVGTVTAGSFSGHLSGTIGAANVSMGDFGFYPNGGGGIWGFPTGRLGVSYSSGQMASGTATFAVNGSVGIGTMSPSEKLTITGGNIKLYSQQNVADSYRYIGTEYDNGNGNNKAEIRFAIDGSDTKTRLTFHTANGAGTLNEQMRITSAGNVGIGTTNPLAPLSVTGNGYFTGSLGIGTTPITGIMLAVTAPDSGTTAIGRFKNSNAASNGAQFGFSSALSKEFEFYNWENGGISFGTNNAYRAKIYASGGLAFGNTYYASDPGLNNAIFQGNVGIGITNPAVKLHVVGESIFQGNNPIVARGVTSEWFSSTQPLTFISGASGPIRFYTGSSNERMRIAETGNVGIGTTNPGQKLSIAGTSVSGVVSQANISAFVNNGMRINGSISDVSQDAITYQSGGGGGGAAIAMGRGGSYDTFMSFYTNPSGGGAGAISERLRIDSAGNIGIGTTTPSAKLSVSGGNIMIDDAVISSTTPHAAITKTYLDSAIQALASTTSYWAANGNKIYNTNTDNVGVGTTNPSTKFEIWGNAGTSTTLAITGGDTDVNDGEEISSLDFRSADGSIRGQNDTAARIVSISQDMTPSDDQNNYVGLGFYLADYHNVTNGLTEMMRLTSYGALGIGTTIPGTDLDVTRNTYSPVLIRAKGDNVDNYIGSAFISESGSDGKAKGLFMVPSDNAANSTWFAGVPYTGGGYSIGNGTGISYISSSGAHNKANSKFFISTAGNIGIGTTTPEAVLDVNGLIKMRNTVITTSSDVINKGYLDSALIPKLTAINVSSVDVNALGDNFLLYGGSTGGWSNRGPSGHNGGAILHIPTHPGGYYSDLWFDTANNRVYTRATNAAAIGGWDQLITASSIGASSGWIVNGTTVYNSNSGNVGIGTTTPGAKLAIGNSLGLTGNGLIDGPLDDRYLDFSGALTNSLMVPNNIITTAGKVGIGTTNPIAKLQLGSNWAPNPPSTNTVYLSNSGFANQNIAPEQIITTNSSSLTPGASIGLDLHNSNTTAGAYAPLLVFSKTEAGSTPYNSAIAAIGARTVTGSGSSDNWIDGDLMFYTAPTVGSGLLERMRIDQAGNVGIGTTSPTKSLDVVGYINASSGLCMGGVCQTSWGSVFSSIAASSQINFNQSDLTNIHKLTVGTIDPLYRIDGTNYSSFASAIVGGVKEEYLGRAKISELNKNKEYEYRLDFSKLSAPSDLWVWRQTIDFSPENVEVNITPYGSFASTYYTIEENAIIFRADRPVSISYRLSGKRLDWQKWPTKAHNQQEKPSFIINNGRAIK